MKRQSKTSNLGTIIRINHDSSKYYNSKLSAELPRSSHLKPEPDRGFPKEFENKIILGEAQQMKEIPDIPL